MPEEDTHSRLGFKTQSIILIIMGAAISIAVMAVSINAARNILQVKNIWSEHNKIANQSDYNLFKITHHMGYGGLIHNFKNFVLRQDPSQIPQIKKNLKEANQAIADYKRLDLSELEIQALSQIKDTLDLYAEHLHTAQHLIAEKASPKEIDQLVQVDDSETLLALETLSLAAIDRNRRMETATAQRLDKSLRLIDYGMIIIPFFIGAVLTSLIFMYRLANTSDRLETQKKQSDDILDAAPESILVINEGGGIERVNSAAENLFGYSSNELTNMSANDLMPEESRERHHDLLRHAFNTLRSRPMEQSSDLFILTKDKTAIPVEISISFTRHNGTINAIAAIRDIRDRLKTEATLRLSRMIFESTDQPILITDEQLGIIDMNDAFCLLSGYQRRDILHRKPSVLQSGKHNKAFYQAMWQELKARDHWKGEIWDKNKRGQIFPALVTISAIRDGKGDITNYVAIYSDITAIKKQEALLTQLANNDQLTKLPNRLLFHDRMLSALARAKRHKSKFAVLYIDLDGFKAVNDALGHAKGDEVLIAAANALLGSIREQDTAARLGGDEFAVIIDELSDSESALQITERIVSALSTTVTSMGQSFPISASIGVAFYPEDGKTDEMLTAHADAAMYEAKRHGKNRYCLYRDIEQ